MSFIAKLFGVDTKAQARAAKAQAEQMRKDAEATRKQSEAIADQTAAQTRLAQDRQRVEEQVRLLSDQAPTETAQVDIGAEGEEEPASRRRRAYQSTGNAAGAIRI